MFQLSTSQQDTKQHLITQPDTALYMSLVLKPFLSENQGKPSGNYKSGS